jgi:hypothetical protein
MTDVAVSTRTVRVKVTMIELHRRHRDLRAVTKQIDDLRTLLAYGQFAAIDSGHRKFNRPTRARDLEARVSVGGLQADWAYVESLTLASPLTVVLSGVASAVGAALFTIINKYNDMRAKHAATNTMVLQQQLKQDAIKLLRKHLAEMDPGSPRVGKAAEHVIADAAVALMNVKSIELLAPSDA